MNDDSSETRAAAAALLRGAPFAGPHLLVAVGPEAGRRIALRQDQTIGRGRAADVQLTDPTASRLHVRVRFESERCVAEDLGSKNGLRLNGKPLRIPRQLVAGDELSVGSTLLRLQPGLTEVQVASGPAPERDGAPEGPATPARAPLPRALLLTLAAALAGSALLLALP